MGVRVHVVTPLLLQSARTIVMDDAQLARDLAGVVLVVNLWHTVDPRLAHMTHHAPTPDGRVTPASGEAFEAAARLVADRLAAGERVLVHCWGGRNRSGVVSARALMMTEGLTAHDAVLRVRAARRSALGNEHFVAWLREREAATCRM